jgi:formate hydrogenlyase subunit 3/multisubunit Na+/H+ antiporter MnhD subunit
MTALVVWSLIPGLFALSLYSLRRWEKAIHVTGVVFALSLAWLAWQYPIGQAISLRLWSGFPIFTIEPEQFIYGNRFTLDNSSRPVLILLYLGAAFWIGGAGPARTHRLFAPLGLLLTAVLAAALAADSVSPAAMLIAVAALVSVPLLSSPGRPAARGVSRYLIFQMIGVCLILFADAELIIATTPGDATQPSLIPALLVLALGFAMILTIVPFHTWLPMLAEEINPYAAAFVFFLLPNTVALLALDILIRYSLIGLPAGTFTALQYAGVLLALAGGIGAAFDRHLGRILGFAAVAQIGMTLLAISLNNLPGRATPLIGIYFSQLVPQAIGLAVWGLALAILRFYLPELSFAAVSGAARRLPVAAMTLVMANLSLAGLPVLASFPVYAALWSSLSQRSLSVVLLCLIGCGGVFLAALRSLANLVAAPDEAPWNISESRLQVVLLVVGASLLLIIGLVPQFYMPILTSMAITFASPAP